MINRESEHSFKEFSIFADIFRRFPMIHDIQTEAEAVTTALMNIATSRWTPRDEEFALLVRTVRRLRSNILQQIDALEPQLFVDGKKDAVVANALREADATLGRIALLADDMSIPSQEETVDEVTGGDVQQTSFQESLDEIERILTLASAYEDSGDFAATIESFFDETLEWADGILNMFENVVEELDTVLQYLGQQLYSEFSPGEKQRIIIGIERIEDLKRMYENGLGLIREMSVLLREKQRRHFDGDTSDLGDDDYPDLDDEWG